MDLLVPQTWDSGRKTEEAAVLQTEEALVLQAEDALVLQTEEPLVHYFHRLMKN